MNRLKQLRTEAKESQEYVGTLIGVSGQAVGQYEIGKRGLSQEKVIILANHYDCSTDYLLGNSNIRYNNNSNPAVVLVYGTIPAGIPMECIEDILDTEEIDANMLKGGKQYIGLKIKGHSMEPDYLDGDTIILEKVEDCESGDDCVVMVNGNEGTFKRIFKNPEAKTITLQPLNMQRDEYGKLLYEPKTYTEEQILNLPIKILGTFVELRRKKKKK